jgi:hypothetical protein
VGHISSVANWGDPWNNSYTGDVYHNISASSLTLTLPAGTAAFYLFIQPNAFSLAEAITVTAQDGTSSTQTVQTNLDGSKYYGFYGTGGTNLTSLTISEPIHSNDFAIGQFAIAAASTNATPEPTTITLFGMGTLGMIGFGCRRKLVII